MLLGDSLLLKRFVHLQYERGLFLSVHREMFCSIDKWHGKTMEEIRQLEEATRVQLDEVE